MLGIEVTEHESRRHEAAATLVQSLRDDIMSGKIQMHGSKCRAAVVKLPGLQEEVYIDIPWPVTKAEREHMRRMAQNPVVVEIDG
jgi:hypothetical protein